MFDFVSGMNEFLTYGSIDMLETYLRNVMTPEEIEQDEILHAMREISDGTKVSEVKKYTEGIQALRRSMSGTSKESRSTFRTRPEFQIFSDMIRRDYGRLLHEDPDDPYSTIDIIERCVAKKMYQQALTFIEAKIPEDYYHHHVLYYDDTEENRSIIHSLHEYSANLDYKYVFFNRVIFDKTKNGLMLGRTVNESDNVRCLAKSAPLLKRVLTDPDFPVIEVKKEAERLKGLGLRARFSPGTIVTASETTALFPLVTHRERIESRILEEILEELENLGKADEDYGKDAEQIIAQAEEIQKMADMLLNRKRYPIIIKSDLPFSPSDEKLPAILWCSCALWTSLKMCRNKLNHGDDRGFTIEELNIVIDVFITYTRYLYDRVNETRGNNSL